MDQKILVWTVGVFAAILFLGRRAKGATMIDVKIGKNFALSEFQRSETIPELSAYVPTEIQIGNLRDLVSKILQPVRDQFGVVWITNGGRPPELKTASDRVIRKLNGQQAVLPAGSSIDDALRLKGYSPAPQSDHHNYSGVDFILPAQDLETHKRAVEFIKSLPATRQVILYTRSDGSAGHIHVSVITAGRPRFVGEKFAFNLSDADGGAAV